MKLLKLSVDRFAGLKNRVFDFTDGVNVLLGDNETGKSTVINALEAALFLPVDIKGTSRAAREQKERLQSILPADGGDVCAVSLIWEHDGCIFNLKKRWGHETLSELCAGDIKHIGDENVNSQIAAMLPFSAATVRSLVFAKQGAFKQTIDNIRAAGAKDISDFLSRAALDMGGVSVQTLRRNLQDEYDRLTGNWNTESGLPNNGRGIDNPYQRGNGDIIEHYYAREQARRELHFLREQEDAAARLSEQIYALADDIVRLEAEDARLSENSGSLLLRREKELEIERLQSELVRIREIKRNWLANDMTLKKLDEAAASEKKLLDDAQLRVKAWEDFDRSEAARGVLDKIKSLDEQASEISKRLDDLPDISESEVREWKNSEKEILLFESEQSSAKITARVTADAPVYAEDSGGRRAVAGELSAQGRVTVYIGDMATVEITAGECADMDRQVNYRVCKQMCRTLADKYGVSNASEAETALRQRGLFESQIRDVRNRRADLLDGRQESELRDEADAHCPDGNREADLQTLDEKKRTLARYELQMEQIKEKLAEYEREFGVYGAALEKEQSLKDAIAPLNLEAERLADASPPEYESAEQFIAHLDGVRAELNEKRGELARLKEEQCAYNADITAKEAAQAVEEHNREMERAVKRAESIDKILKAVDETLLSVRARAYRGLTDRFCGYLSRLTQGRYAASELDDELGFTLRRANLSVSPVLLSEGTADALALAFRFAMLDDIMGERGLCMLDDCLVDLDGERAKSAAELIRGYARSHQVVFATCSGATANLLGGNIIHMQERI